MELNQIGFDELKAESICDLAKYEYLRITDYTAIDPPIPRITINNEIICTEGNITTISGESKSGKSAFASVLMAGAISITGEVDGFDQLYVEPNFKKKGVIHFDTEQARHKHQYNVKTIIKRAYFDSTPDYFRSYNIRQEDLVKYQKITSDLCEAVNTTFKGIHMIVIDGIADYINDVNDPVQSNAIVKYFEELAIRYHTPLIVIVHTNPGSDKERGHLGSQCQRKSESVLVVKSDHDISFIQPKFLRMAGKGNIPLHQFKYDQIKGYHTSCGIRNTQSMEKDITRIEIIRAICMKLFNGQKSYQYKDAIDAIIRETGKGETTAKNHFKEMKAHLMISKGEDGNWRKVNNDNSSDEVV